MTRRATALALAAIVVATAATAACKPAASTRYSRKQAQRSLHQLEAPGLTLGELRISQILDGDTFKIEGLDSTLRLIGLDAEETFKRESERRAVEAGWDRYVADMRGDRPRPVKMATPLGERAKAFAKQFFAGVDKVKIERDHPAEIRDRFDRYLAYVLVRRGGAWVNYNVECVRAGMSPYFVKYGYSRRFHDELVAAQAEAKAARRGIWADGVMKYPDYPEREAWWEARGAFVEAFRRAGAGKPGYIDLTHWDSLKQLEDHVGKEVHLLATVADVRLSEHGPSRVTLARRTFADFPLIFFDRDVLGTSGITGWRGEYVVVTGVPTFYENPRTHRKQLQIQVDRASQIELSPVPGLTPPTTTLGP